MKIYILSQSLYENLNINDYEDVELHSVNMPVYCAWCKKHMSGPNPGYNTPGNSHGICQKCMDEIMKNLN